MCGFKKVQSYLLHCFDKMFSFINFSVKIVVYGSFSSLCYNFDKKENVKLKNYITLLPTST